MNEEEIRELVRQSMLETLKTNLDSTMIFTYVKSLEDKIEKAIEYLKDNACYENTISELFCDDLDTDSCMELLDILRGEEDEKYKINK